MQSQKLRHRASKAHGHLLRYGREMGRSILTSAIAQSREVCSASSQVEFAIEFTVVCRFGLGIFCAPYPTRVPVLAGMEEAFVGFNASYFDLLRKRTAAYQDAIKDTSDAFEIFSKLANSWAGHVETVVEIAPWGWNTLLSAFNSFTEIVIPDAGPP